MAWDIMFPFYAGLLDGVATISEPCMKYRVHGDQTSLSIAYDLAEGALRKRVVEERIWEAMLAHAIYMTDVLDQLVTADANRFRSMRDRLKPLLIEQTVRQARRLVETRQRLFYDFDVKEIQSP